MPRLPQITARELGARQRKPCASMFERRLCRRNDSWGEVSEGGRSPPPNVLVRFLKSQGFVDDRQAGSHLTLWHEGRQTAITIPVQQGSDVGRGLAVRILKDAGFSVDDYLRLR